jgi:ribosomal protein L7/L12
MAKAPQDLPANVLEALSRGNALEAIKRLREAKGLGLAEAKHVVDAYRRQGKAAPARPEAPASVGIADTAMPPAAIDALERGNKIEAVRLVREHAGIGLKQAKDAVDAYERAHPRLDPMVAPGEVRRGSGLVGWITAAVIVGLLVYWYFRR